MEKPNLASHPLRGFQPLYRLQKPVVLGNRLTLRIEAKEELMEIRVGIIESCPRIEVLVSSRHSHQCQSYRDSPQLKQRPEEKVHPLDA